MHRTSQQAVQGHDHLVLDYQKISKFNNQFWEDSNYIEVVTTMTIVLMVSVPFVNNSCTNGAVIEFTPSFDFLLIV